LSDASFLLSDYPIKDFEFRLGLADSNKLEKCIFGKNDKSFFKLTKFTKREVIINNQSKNFKLPFFSAELDDSGVLRCNQGVNMMTKIMQGNIRQIFITSNWQQLPALTTLLLDGLVYASYGRIEIGTKRFIQIDIDDIFVGDIGIRMKPTDVEALVNFQNNFLNTRYFNSSANKFKFNLGFSGFYYQHGNNEENLADELLISMYTS